MEIWQLIIIFLMALSVLIVFIAYNFFNEDDSCMDCCDNYQVAEQPFVALKNNCKHTGEKSLVAQWTICGCEKVNLHCDDCGDILKQGDVEC